MSHVTHSTNKNNDYIITYFRSGLSLWPIDITMNYKNVKQFEYHDQWISGFLANHVILRSSKPEPVLQ